MRVLATIFGKTYWQMREISSGSHSHHDIRAHFGLGNATNVEVLRIEWPSGQVTELHNVASKQFLTIVEPPGLNAVGRGVGFQLRLTGNIGSRYELQSSTNLLDWASWRWVTNTSRTELITDPASIGHPYRFYKLVQP